MTKPEQSNPDGEAPPQTYGVPRYCIAIPTTPPWVEGAAGAAGEDVGADDDEDDDEDEDEGETAGAAAAVSA
jgi:hypothetical protein